MSIVSAVSIVVIILLICQSGRFYQKLKTTMSFEGKSSKDKYKAEDGLFEDEEDED